MTPTCGGYIRLYRKITDWEWYDDDATFRLFLHLLLTVNWKDGRWHGEQLRRGERITSYRKLAEETNLTVKTVRRCLKKLETTGEVSVQSGRTYTRFKVCNFNEYQGCPEREEVDFWAEKNFQKTTKKQRLKSPKRAHLVTHPKASDCNGYNDCDTPEGAHLVTHYVPHLVTHYVPTIEEGKKERREDNKYIFAPPTVEDVEEYGKKRVENGHPYVDPEAFVDYYESKGWKVGKSPMKSWQAAYRTWERNKKGKRSSGSSSSFLDIEV